MTIKGVYTALVTPFSRGTVNLKKLEELVERAQSAGIAGVVPIGTTGESPTLEDEEREAVIKTVVKAADHKLKVIVGAGSNSTHKTIKNVHEAAKLGADAVLLVAPYYNKPTEEGLKYHFKAIADNSPLPIILYHIPSRCGVGIPLNLVLQLAHHPQVIGVKEAGGDVWRSSEIARRAPADFSMLSGDDNLTLPLMSVGATGTIAVISNIAPKMTRDMVDHTLNNRFDKALDIHRKLAPLLEALSAETNPGPIKEAMNQAGLNVGPVRAPLADVRPSTKKLIQKALNTIGTIE